MPESWWEAMGADLEAASRQVTVPRIAAALHKSDSFVYQLLRGEKLFSLGFLKSWYDLTGAKHLMQWAGRVTNHHCVPVPVGRIDDIQYAEFLREFSDVVAEYTTAVSDGDVTADEAERVDQQLEELINAAMRLQLATRRRVRVLPLRPGSMAEAEHKANGGAA